MQQMFEPEQKKQAQRPKNRDGFKTFLPYLRALVRYLYLHLPILQIIEILTNCLSIIITFLITYLSDIFIIWILTNLFGNVLLAGVALAHIFPIIVFISGIGALIACMLTILTFLIMFIIVYLRVPSGTAETELKDIKTIFFEQGRLVGLTLRDTVVLTFIFLIFVGVIVLILVIVTQVPPFASALPGSYIDPIRFFTAVVIAILYLVTVVRALWLQLKDFFSRFFKKHD